MLTIILIFMGVIVVGGAIYLAMSSGNRGGRHQQSGESVVNAQRQEKVRANSERATGGGDD
jgi:hypothetical protein